MSGVREHDVLLTPHDIDHLNAGQPVFKGMGDDIRLVLLPTTWDQLKAIESDNE